jgi:hypothetical protein
VTFNGERAQPLSFDTALFKVVFKVASVFIHRVTNKSVRLYAGMIICIVVVSIECDAVLAYVALSGFNVIFLWRCLSFSLHCEYMCGCGELIFDVNVDNVMVMYATIKS